MTYLEFRGLDHLCEFVVWSENTDHRSKNYINILKMRLQYHVPEKCNNILKNEAHVRLATSMWYVAGALIGCAITSGAIVLAGLLLAFARNILYSAPVHGAAIWNMSIISLSITLFIYLFSRFIRNSVESFIHYQRQREVIHVLETAWIAFSENAERRLPPFQAPKTV